MKKLIVVVCSLSWLACEAPRSRLEVSIYGESFIEDEIPAEEVSDGWRVQFDRFLVSVAEVTVARGHEAPDVAMTEARVFDLAKSSDSAGYVVVDQEVPAGIYDHLEYRIAPPAAGKATVGNAAEADLQLLLDRGASVYVEGTAEKDGQTKHFAWAFDTDARYSHCDTTIDAKSGETGAAQLTIHGDHLLYDDLFSETPNVAFQLIADADANQDGEITQAELQAMDLRTQARYQVGSTGITDLWRFIRFQTTSVGHIDGEGHCEVTRQP